MTAPTEKIDELFPHQNFPESKKKNASSKLFYLLYASIGGLTGALWFLPATVIAMYVLDYVLFSLLKYRESPIYKDDSYYLVVIILIKVVCWPLAAFLGVIGGLLGEALVRKRTGKVGRSLGAFIGGLAASLIVAFLLSCLMKSWEI